MPIIKAELGSRSHDILIGQDLCQNLEKRLHKLATGGRLWTVYDATFYALHGNRLKKNVPSLRVGKRELVLPGGESVKTAASLKAVHTFLLGEGVTRHDVVVAIGGGTVTDMTGFAAATTMRGIRWVAIPTTFLGMVDAAIGGKTALNHKLGKNLIGAIWQPSLVGCDISFLGTLPKRQMISGLGEVIKYGGLVGREMIEQIESYLASGEIHNLPGLARLVKQSTEYKASVVTADERESGLRMILNLGHTFGHGIERSLNYKRLTHGEAVIIGLLAAIELSVRTSVASARSLEKYRHLVTYALSLLPKVAIDTRKALDAMTHDKKRNPHSLKFVLLKRPGKPIVKEKIGSSAIAASLKAALAEYQK